jgi:hypothetical protein
MVSLVGVSCTNSPPELPPLVEPQPAKQPSAESTNNTASAPETPLTSEEYGNEVVRIFTSLEFADYLQRTLQEAVKNGNGNLELPILERVATSYSEEFENALSQWDSITPPQEFVKFHNCYHTVLTEQRLLSESLLSAIASSDIEEVINIISVMGDSELSPECEAVIKNATEIMFGRQLIIDDTTPQEPIVIPAPLPTPTPELTPSPTTSISVQTPETEQVSLNKNDFLITIIPNRQVTLTNNSQITVEVYKFSMTYDFYSYIMHNPDRYGPIVTGKIESDESAQLKSGQSFPKTFNRSDIVAIRSCSFYVRANGQELVVTYGK